ncbi:MAG: hypothetical protein CMN57_09610 [Gammaproteobacteria bacterium]|nr:hypothetical protein [Gammaproteobacteria bacterium]
MKPRLTASLAAWGEADFAAILQHELAALKPEQLPLSTATGYAESEGLTLTLIRQAEEPDCLRLRVGVFFEQILAGCSCGDEPMRESAYCELDLMIDKADGKTEILPVP